MQMSVTTITIITRIIVLINGANQALAELSEPVKQLRRKISGLFKKYFTGTAGILKTA